jgi:hypothetical protein
MYTVHVTFEKNITAEYLIEAESAELALNKVLESLYGDIKSAYCEDITFA